MATRIDPALAENTTTTNPPPATPTGLTAAPTNSTKLKGTDGNDVFTLSDLQRDSDHVITTGAGDDVFRFNGDEGKRNVGDQNGIVKFGPDAGPDSHDQVFLGYQLTDYVFTLRSEGGIKIQYTGDDASHPVDGAAVTFYGADLFTFRGASDTGGQSVVPHTYTYDQLVLLINQSAVVPTA